jgi:KDO2-lipid IV(A) lauroyltransferase
MNPLLLYGPISLLARWLPRRTGYAMAAPVCAWAFRRRPPARQALAANLRVALAANGEPPAESDIDALVRKTFINFGKYVVDFFRMGQLSPEGLERIVAVENAEYLHQCIALDTGILGVTGHVGNWELGASVLVAHGCPIAAVVRTQPTPRLDALFQRRRIGRGMRVLPMSGGAAAALAGLKRKDWVILLADLDFSAREPGALLFGKPARLPRGPAILAARSRAPILPGFVIRQPDETFRMRLYPPLLPGPSPSADAIQARITAILEDVITAHPDQWFAFEPMWPVTPPTPRTAGS